MAQLQLITSGFTPVDRTTAFFRSVTAFVALTILSCSSCESGNAFWRIIVICCHGTFWEAHPADLSVPSRKRRNEGEGPERRRGSQGEPPLLHGSHFEYDGEGPRPRDACQAIEEVDNVLFESHSYTRFNGSWREENQAYPLELLLPQYTSRGKKNVG